MEDIEDIEVLGAHRGCDKSIPAPSSQPPFPDVGQGRLGDGCEGGLSGNGL